jgi:hypothetical protein
MAPALQVLPLLLLAMQRQGMLLARTVQQQGPRVQGQQLVLGRVMGLRMQLALQKVLMVLVVLVVMAGWSMKWKCWQ